MFCCIAVEKRDSTQRVDFFSFSRTKLHLTGDTLIISLVRYIPPSPRSLSTRYISFVLTPRNTSSFLASTRKDVDGQEFRHRLFEFASCILLLDRRLGDKDRFVMGLRWPR